MRDAARKIAVHKCGPARCTLEALHRNKARRDFQRRKSRFRHRQRAEGLYGQRGYDCFEAKKPRNRYAIKESLDLDKAPCRPQRLLAGPGYLRVCHAPFQAVIEKRRTQLVRKAPRQPAKSPRIPEKSLAIQPRALKNKRNFSIGIAVAISEARGKPLLISTPLMTLQQTQESMTWR
jgi:hypothetical protein